MQIVKFDDQANYSIGKLSLHNEFFKAFLTTMSIVGNQRFMQKEPTVNELCLQTSKSFSYLRHCCAKH